MKITRTDVCEIESMKPLDLEDMPYFKLISGWVMLNEGFEFLDIKPVMDGRHLSFNALVNENRPQKLRELKFYTMFDDIDPGETYLTRIESVNRDYFVFLVDND